MDTSRRILLDRLFPESFLYRRLPNRYLVVTGLSDRVTSEDLQRFFHGYALHAKSVTFVREKRVRKRCAVLCLAPAIY